jgi:hypothetical protein
LTVFALLCFKISAPAKADVLALTSGGREYTPYSMSAVGTVLFIHTLENVLFSYDIAAGKARQLEINLPDELILVENSDEVLYLSIRDGCLYRLNTTQDQMVCEKMVQLNFIGLLNLEDVLKDGLYGGAMFPFLRAILQGDTLYLMISTENIPQSVVAFDLSTGKRTAMLLKDIWDFAAYKKDSMLVISYSMGDQKSGIGLCNTQSGELREWMLLPSLDCDNGLVYDETSDTVYVLGAGAIYASKAGAPFGEAGYSSIEQNAQVSNVAVVEGKYFALVPGKAVYCFPLDLAKPAASLHLMDGWWDIDAVKAFRNAYPDIPLIFESFSNENTDQLQKRMLTGDAYFDVYVADAGAKVYDAMLTFFSTKSICG